MNTDQLLQQIATNRNLIASNNEQALEHLQMLKKNYIHLANEQVHLSIELNFSLAELHFKSNYEGAIENSLRAFDKFKNSGHNILLASHLKTIGHCFAHIGEFDLAEKNLLEALSIISVDEQDYAATRSDILHTLAMTEDIKDESPEKAIAYLTEAINLLNDEKHAIIRANCLMGLGNIYNNAEQIDEALTNYRKAADTFEQNYALRNMASVYSNIGNCYIKLADYVQAEQYHGKALDLRMKSGSPDDISISYFNLAIVYKDQKDFAKSEEYLIKTKAILERIGNKPFIKMANEMMDDLDRLKAEPLLNSQGFVSSIVLP